MPRVTIQLFSSFAVFSDGAPISGFRSPRLQELLAYLLIYRNAPQHRARLAYIMWPDSNDEQARTNLRNLLHQLKHTLPDATQFLNQDGQAIQWNTCARYELDVEHFEHAVAEAERERQSGSPSSYQYQLKEAIAAYKGDLLLNGYSNWMIAERERLSRAYTHALEALILTLEKQGEYTQAIDFAHCLLRQAPLHEGSYSTLMRLQGLNGDRAGAVSTYQVCKEMLQRELGVDPGPATLHVYENLLKLERPAAAKTSPEIGDCPLIGRHNEWARLRQAWKSAWARKPQLLVLEGEAGSGKTRLLKEFLQSAYTRAGAQTAYARCNYSERLTAFAPLYTWMRALSNGLQEINFNDDAGWELPNLHNGHRRRIYEEMARAVLGSGQPLILCLDDLQWCDSDSLEWLQYLLQNNPQYPLLITASMRPGAGFCNPALVRFFVDVREDASLTEILLRRLSREETRLLGSSLARRLLNSEQLKCLFEETEGNPFFIHDAIRSKKPFGRQAYEELSAEARFLLEDCLACLSPRALEIGGIASCIGRKFLYPMLKEIYRNDEMELAFGLDELCQQHIVCEVESEGFEFSHKKIHQAMYARFGPALRRVYISRIEESRQHHSGVESREY